ncbi:MAG: winged helix-turn-helix domain-containing protein [Elusimicrobiota bacterium]|nr:winged helix-turn-helix domain-containing protein [Elusimicrobiota bacterium]
MLIVSRDAEWTARLRDLAARGGWPVEVRREAPEPGRAHPPERALVILDRALTPGACAKAVAALRELYPWAAVAVACAEAELAPEPMAETLASGADDVLGKPWPDAKLLGRLAVLRDRALSAEERVSADGGLRLERRSLRVYAKAGARWRDLGLSNGDFEVLWRLLAREGEPVAREELAGALGEATGRPVELEAAARRVQALRPRLRPWKGRLLTVRGGGYRLVSTGA